MVSSFIEIINISIRFLFVIKSIQYIIKMETTKINILWYFILYLLGYYIIGEDDIRKYLFRCGYSICIILIFFKRNNKYEYKTKEIFYLTCACLLMYELANILCAVMGAVVIYFIEPNKLQEIYFGSAFLIIKIIVAIFLYNIYIKEVKERKYLYGKKYVVIFIYLLIVCMKIPFLYTDIKDALAWKLVVLAIICCTIIFLIISKIEKRNAEQEKARIEENNKILSTKLHKSREILPAMVQVLSNVTENNGIEMEQQEAYKLLQEVNDLYGQQLKENSKEDLQLKSFCSTGLKILDQQLNIYQREAVDKDVNFDIYVQAPINELLKRDDIDQLRLQRALGDLVRNAFRSTEREDKKCRAKGHILLIIGCRYEDILEISVVDNGLAFPLEVIEAFGKRGITTGGTGNGLADLVDFTKEIKASICLDEFDGRTNSFTKKISIIFDKKGINYFNSARKGKVTDPFWSTT